VLSKTSAEDKAQWPLFAVLDNRKIVEQFDVLQPLTETRAHDHPVVLMTCGWSVLRFLRPGALYRAFVEKA
jgi:hypothetical protein